MKQPLFAVPADFTIERAAFEVDLDAPGYEELLDAMFRKYDLNIDGVVTAEEYIDPVSRWAGQITGYCGP